LTTWANYNTTKPAVNASQVIITRNMNIILDEDVNVTVLIIDGRLRFHEDLNVTL